MRVAGLLVLAVICLSIECTAHVDDTDAALYTVVARNMVRDGTWFDLSYTTNVHPQFREHLPFGLWPSAMVIRTLGEAALPWLSAAWTLLTIALVVELGKRLGSIPLGLLGGFLLATTNQFIVTGALHRLDPPLLFFSLLSAAPLLVAPRTRGAFVLTVTAGALACLIKGPFGLVLPVAAAIARAVQERDRKWLLVGALACVFAAVPVTAFLLTASPDWRSGYVDAQLLASARGSRTDGNASPWFPFVSVGNFFWPWLPLVALGIWRAWGDRTARLVLTWAALALLFLALPSRKLWHHTLLVFPALSLVAATGVPLARMHGLVLQIVVALVSIGTVVVLAFNPHSRAVSCLEFAERLQSLPPDSVVLVTATSQGAQWREIAILAKELRLRPWLVDSVAAAPLEAKAALVAEPLVPADDTSWHEVGRARGWVLLQR